MSQFKRYLNSINEMKVNSSFSPSKIKDIFKAKKEVESKIASIVDTINSNLELEFSKISSVGVQRKNEFINEKMFKEKILLKDENDPFNEEIIKDIYSFIEQKNIPNLNRNAENPVIDNCLKNFRHRDMDVPLYVEIILPLYRIVYIKYILSKHDKLGSFCLNAASEIQKSKTRYNFTTVDNKYNKIIEAIKEVSD